MTNKRRLAGAIFCAIAVSWRIATTGPNDPLPPAVCEHGAGGDSIVPVFNDWHDRATVLVDGYGQDGRCINDLAVSSTYWMPLGNLVPGGSPCSSREIVAFGPHQAMQWLDGTNCWTADSDQVQLRMNVGPLPIPVTLWKAGAAPEDAIVIADAQTELQRANVIFSEAGTGIVLEKPSSVRAVPSAEDIDCDRFARIRVPDTLNVIFVYDIPIPLDPSARGFACDDHQTIMRERDADGETLAHEIGHALALNHFDGDSANVMASGEGRSFLTEGQSFRANVREASTLNSPLHLRTGRTEACVDDSKGECPNLYCTGCPFAPVKSVPLRTLEDIESTWLSCEECAEGQLDAIASESRLIDRFIDDVGGAIPAQQLLVLQKHFRVAYFSILAYEADPRHWQRSGSEAFYVATYTENYRARRQIRSARALVALAPRMSAVQRARAMGVLGVTARVAERSDVRKAVNESISVLQ